MESKREVLLDGSRSMIAFAAGRTYTYAVAMDTPIKVVKLERPQLLRPATLKEKPYPVSRAARIYLKSELPITKRASQILRALIKRQAVAP